MPGDGQQQKLRLGILSAAGIAVKNVRGLKSNTRGIEIVAVASRSLEKAQKFVKEQGLEGSTKALGSYEELISDSSLDALYIPLPAGPRKQWVLKAAAAGKHIMCEKPCALTAKDMDDILEACSKHNVQFMDGTMWLHNPRSKYIKEYLGNKDLMGPLKTVVCHFHMACPPEFLKDDVRTFKDLDGLGCYGDIGWYCLSHIVWAFNYDPPQTVQATAGPMLNDRGVVMHGGGSLVWKDGRRAQLDCGFFRNLVQDVAIGGENGSLHWDDLCIPRREDVCEFRVFGKGGFSTSGVEQTVETKKVYVERPQETEMWNDFADCVYAVRAGGKPDAHWPMVSNLTTKLCIALHESAENDCKPIEFRP